MTMTSETPVPVQPAPKPDTSAESDLGDLRALESRLELRSSRRDNRTVVTFCVSLAALVFSFVAIGFSVRAVDESTGTAQAAPVAPATASAPVALSSVTLGDMTVTPSSSVTPAGTFNVNITNSGMMAHELLVFHTDTAAANMPIGPDGKVAEDTPGLLVSDGENLDPGGSQSRSIDLTQPGTYLFVCNLPGHFAAGMHATVTVK